MLFVKSVKYLLLLTGVLTIILFLFRKLFAHFETYKQKNTKPTDTAAKQKTTTAPSGSEHGMLYQLRYRPEQSQLQQASRVAELEQRLNKLENILGTSNENMASLQYHNLMYDDFLLPFNFMSICL